MDSIPGLEDPLEEEMATYSSILAWKNPRTEESGGLQSKGLQRVRYDEHIHIIRKSNICISPRACLPVGHCTNFSNLESDWTYPTSFPKHSDFCEVLAFYHSC